MPQPESDSNPQVLRLTIPEGVQRVSLELFFERPSLGSSTLGESDDLPPLTPQQRLFQAVVKHQGDIGDYVDGLENRDKADVVDNPDSLSGFKSALEPIDEVLRMRIPKIYDSIRRALEVLDSSDSKAEKADYMARALVPQFRKWREEHLS